MFPRTANILSRYFKSSWQQQQPWFVTPRANPLGFKIPVTGVMGSQSNCLLSSYCICSPARRFFCLRSHHRSVIANELLRNRFCGGRTPTQNVHTLRFMLGFPTNPLITLWTNVCQKTTSQMRTLRIQWHTWIKAGRVRCQTSAAVENIKDKLDSGRCQRESICCSRSIGATLFLFHSKLCERRKKIMRADWFAGEENYFQQMFHRCTRRMVAITNHHNPVWHHPSVCCNILLLQYEAETSLSIFGGRRFPDSIFLSALSSMRGHFNLPAVNMYSANVHLTFFSINLSIYSV